MVKLIDRLIFLVICVVLLTLLVLWKGCDMKGGGLGIGLPGGQPGGHLGGQQESQANGQPDDQAKQHDQLASVSKPQEQKNTSLVAATDSVPIAKLFLGDKGITEDLITWHDMDEFADYIKQLQEKGIKEVHYTLLPDSIPRYEESWEAELKKANMRSYEEKN